MHNAPLRGCATPARPRRTGAKAREGKSGIIGPAGMREPGRSDGLNARWFLVDRAGGLTPLLRTHAGCVTRHIQLYRCITLPETLPSADRKPKRHTALSAALDISSFLYRLCVRFTTGGNLR